MGEREISQPLLQLTLEAQEMHLELRIGETEGDTRSSAVVVHWRNDRWDASDPLVQTLLMTGYRHALAKAGDVSPAEVPLPGKRAWLQGLVLNALARDGTPESSK